MRTTTKPREVVERFVTLWEKGEYKTQGDLAKAVGINVATLARWERVADGWRASGADGGRSRVVDKQELQESLSRMYRDALRDGDRQGADRLADRLAKLGGDYAPEKHETVNVTAVLQLGDGGLAQAIAEDAKALGIDLPDDLLAEVARGAPRRELRGGSGQDAGRDHAGPRKLSPAVLPEGWVPEGQSDGPQGE